MFQEIGINKESIPVSSTLITLFSIIFLLPAVSLSCLELIPSDIFVSTSVSIPNPDKVVGVLTSSLY